MLEKINNQREGRDIKDQEIKNNRYVIEELKSKYEEKIKENSIKIFSELSGTKEIKSIYKIETDSLGSGGNIGLAFENGDKYLYIDKNGKINDGLFNNIYKTDKNSFDNIITIMTDLINRSGYSENEKSKMQREIISYLDSIIKKD